ncbi:MAG TPA: ABC transporter substrate-binding protein [Acetobacteraceae bacterium]|nr:ABC transporter substrate-binding protein [Acetobacteraceae bacterium]
MIRLAGLVCALAVCLAGAAQAQISDDAVKIGVLNDMAGPYADFAGPGTVVAARMAVEDFGGQVLGKPIEVIAADHQNKPDIGAAIARRWFDVEHVDMAIDMPNSAVALVVQQIAREAHRVSINLSAASTDLTGKACSPTGMHWVSDSYANSHGTTLAVVKQGGDSWFFITVDYEGGYANEREAQKVLDQTGGKLVGRVRHPINAADFSSYLVQAQNSGAKIVALANGGSDTVNAIKQAAEFGLTSHGQKLVGMFVNITDIHALGLPAAQGLILTEGWYWDHDEESRAFAKRFLARHKAMPTQYQAGAYSAVTHYLKAIQAAGTDQAEAVVAKMREMPVNDMFAKHGVLREDGRMVHDMLLMQVKQPFESTGEWDVYKILATIPGNEAFRSLADSACPLVKK